MSELTPIDPDPIRVESEKALRAAVVCKMRRDTWGAFVDAQRACQIDPQHLAAHELASDYARELAQWDDALFHLEQANELDPDNADLSGKLELLRRDAELYARPISEVLSDATEGGASWQEVFRSVFLRPDPLWYQSGWFHQLLAFAGMVLFVLLVRWVFTTGPWLFLFGLLHVGMVAWVAYDARMHGEPAIFWGLVAMFGSLFGLALYLTVRGMGSGIGMQGGGRFFSG